MRFLLPDDAADDVRQAFAEAGHKVMTSAEIDLAADASPIDRREAARRHQLELIVTNRQSLDAVLPGSGDKATFGRTLIFLNSGPSDAPLAVHRLFDRYKRLSPGRLYSVSPQRVKVSQLPSGPL
ncbi:MAG: hypothetical protein AAGI46_08360 [Planctomycetota bacterium]